MSILFTVAAGALAISHAHVMLRFTPEYPLPQAAERAAITEAAAIWSPYGVVVTRFDPTRRLRDEDLVLTVVMSVAPAPPEAPWTAPLGAVDFDADGTPARVMTVFVDRLLGMLAGARLWDMPAANWPRMLRERVIGRAVGRVIAHEVGHVLLRSKQHTVRGLMRAIQRADELVDPARRRYTLSS